MKTEIVTKEKLEAIVLNGIAADIFIAERAYKMFKAIGERSEEIVKNRLYASFFGCSQEAFKDQFLMATARLYDKPSTRYETRCIEGLLNFLSENKGRLPRIREWTNLFVALRYAGFSERELSISWDQDLHVTAMIIDHYRKVLNDDIKKDLENLRVLRNKQLAHNELVKEFNGPTFKALLSLIDHAKNLVGIIGWGYMNMIFTHEGSYHLTADAERPKHSLMKLVDRLSSDVEK